MVIIQVGDVPESNTYIGQKIKFGEKVGASVKLEKLPEKISQTELIGHINQFNDDPNVNGIIVQLPIPSTLDKDKIIDTIEPKKDVDGQTATNIKLLFEVSSSRHPELISGSNKVPGEILNQVQNDKLGGKRFTGFIPATTKGILTLLDYYKIPVESKYVVIIGRSSLVGKPTALAFLNKDATVTVCHKKTKNLARITKGADILVVAAGRPKLITKDHVTRGQVIIDVGINVVNESPVTGGQRPETELPTHKLVGDVDFESVSKIVQAISPVPGGCGPMTVASLFQNLLEAYNRQV